MRLGSSLWHAEDRVDRIIDRLVLHAGDAALCAGQSGSSPTWLRILEPFGLRSHNARRRQSPISVFLRALRSASSLLRIGGQGCGPRKTRQFGPAIRRSTCAATASRGTSGRASTRSPAKRPGPATSLPGGSGIVPEADLGCCRTISRARTRSSSAAARRMFPPGWRGAARGSSASTIPRRSSPRRGACSCEHGLDFPLLHGNAEAVPYPDAVVRLRHLRVRRMPVGRSAALGARGRAAAAPRRPPRLSRQLVPDDPVHAGGGRRRRDRSAAAPGVRHVPHRVAGRERASSSTSRTAIGSRLLRRSGFEIEELMELRPPATTRRTRYPFVTLDWARQWPCEEVWKVRKRA